MDERASVRIAGGFWPAGGRLALLRKIHLFGARGFGESTFIKPGPSAIPVVFELGGVGSA
ncbi:hypothetical protein NG701_01160 [Pseudarthrobacter sp. HLT3-5]|uniref:hypothetical protein n=1 Tax=Pseudarthrobacter cellobiosi TaxID=2953654 RepID=UPI00208FEC2C|nr:hypothetical protein [Pseudarthrobacter sp. HLT3-5]MCO4273054.1 hypothetical protein [Pseudarthrobacter sp. HLT3-5]